MSDKLLNGLKQLKFSSEQIKIIFVKMDKYIKEIILFNSAYNLTNTSDYDEIVINHILDSLSATSLIKEISTSINSSDIIKIGDIGSGGGLPGIPLAVSLPDFQFTLVERMDKRCAFLENVIAILGLKNVTVLKKEAEQVPKESFDIATFRAFRPLDNKMTKTLLNLIKTNGFLAAYKAKSENIKQEMSEISNIIPEYEIKKLSVPFLTDTNIKESRERNLVVIKKF